MFFPPVLRVANGPSEPKIKGAIGIGVLACLRVLFSVLTAILDGWVGSIAVFKFNFANSEKYKVSI
ncbi:hypothetical protein A3206_08090 [Candidatus Methanomassiliicoccus intestinalis]|uniref:Uncharacterized protein n=1 Tax=Methanomassiliicoccus intestinalis (strain Issoire-Mx1) TaxID=1295009 RepID=R9TC07_METII|nr:hypothetical protein MMINT_16965 [Candidatus Methanomassiliicoccus intestinalis Issoire-Mx1]TQS79156.1 MAG: hypothetical protein A3206_08090 [Candidatus Methanomassiliicoccus intestinalis]